MWAFIIAGLVFAATAIVSILVFMADAMADVRGDGTTSAGWVLLTGSILTALIVASHWLPPIGW